LGAFEYTALNTTGRLKKGIQEGDNDKQIRQILRDKGLIPVSIEEIAQKGSTGNSGFQGLRKITPFQLSLLTRQLATLVRSGTVLEEALSTTAEQTEKAKVKSIVMALRSKVMEGHGLAASMQDFPAIFSNLYCATVAAGEQVGRLDLVLERLADYTESRHQLRQKIILALLYPTILTLVAIAVVAALMVYVVPQIVNVFENIGQELPILTRMLIKFSAFLQDYGLVLLIIAILIPIIFRFILRSYHARYNFHRLLLSTPLLAKLARGMNTAVFTKTFSILTESGVPILEGMKISAGVLSNLPMKEAVEQAAIKVREGASVHKSLAKSGYFPPITIHLIASGEASANLESMLSQAARDQEREVETLVATLIGVFEPVLILLMGGIVLVIVLAILLPIFDLNQMVK
jgi:general secretion pathway protein F